MKKIKIWIKEHRLFSSYFLISVLVTFIDIFVSRLCEIRLNEVESNTIGVISGFIVQYFLCASKVYKKNDAKTALIFFLTWLLGLGIADSVVYVCRVILFDNKKEIIYFFIAKGFSIVIPFFFIYYLRKRLITTKG